MPIKNPYWIEGEFYESAAKAYRETGILESTLSRRREEGVFTIIHAGRVYHVSTFPPQAEPPPPPPKPERSGALMEGLITHRLGIYHDERI
jgi:hypothetical protein